MIGHFTLAPGRYVIIPSAAKPGMQCDFMLRVFCADGNSLSVENEAEMRTSKWFVSKVRSIFNL